VSLLFGFGDAAHAVVPSFPLRWFEFSAESEETKAKLRSVNLTIQATQAKAQCARRPESSSADTQDQDFVPAFIRQAERNSPATKRRFTSRLNSGWIVFHEAASDCGLGSASLNFLDAMATPVAESSGIAVARPTLQ